MDTCEFCKTDYGPCSSERNCRVCGAPRASWECYVEEPPRSMRRRVQKGSELYGSGRIVLPPLVATTITVAPPEPALVETFDIVCLGMDVVRMIEARIGRVCFATDVQLSAKAIESLEDAAERELVTPWNGMRINLLNTSSMPVDASVDLTVMPLSPGCTTTFKADDGRLAALDREIKMARIRAEQEAQSISGFATGKKRKRLVSLNERQSDT